LRHLCNTSFPTLMQHCNYGRLWSSNPRIKCTLDLLPQLGCFVVKCGKCFQFGVKRDHISKTSCNKWIHNVTHPLCLCIICIWISLVFIAIIIIIIHSAMETHQGEPLGGALFTLSHFRALCSIAIHYLSCLFSIRYRWHSHHKSLFYFIIYILTFRDWISCNRSFYPTS